MMEPDNLSLVALTPGDLPVAQGALVEWLDRKAEHVRGIVADLRKNLEIATRNRWGSRQSLQSALTREERRITFYENAKAAINAGYLIIPNLPVDALAVRVKRAAPTQVSGEWRDANQLIDVAPDKGLAAGDGRYVDDQKPVEDHSYKTPDPKAPGQMVNHRLFITREYDDAIDFPLTEVKPALLEAAEKALALRIFDSIGLVRPRRKGDPILVGTVHDWSDRYQDKRLTFFIGWYFNTEDI